MCYCRGVHTATAELLGIASGSVGLAIDNFDLAPVPDKIKPVLQYAQKLTRQFDSVTQEDANAIFRAGWEETALYHTVAVTALFNFMNRFVEGLGIELDPLTSDRHPNDWRNNDESARCRRSLLRRFPGVTFFQKPTNSILQADWRLDRGLTAA